MIASATATATAAPGATATATATAPVVSFSSLAVLKGKGVTATEKAEQHVKNGAEMGALLAQSIGRKAIINAISDAGMAKTIHALSVGNIRPAAALVTAKSGKAVSIMEENGKAPYSEWLRMGATLNAAKKHTNAGKPTATYKAYILWCDLTDKAAELRAKREDANKKQALESAGM